MASLSPFNCLEQPGEKNIVLIKLNTPISGSDLILKTLWQKASLKALVDGAVNELYNCPALPRDKFIPDFISGDFDSAEPHVLQFYRNRGVQIISTPDQNETDFVKCLRIVCDQITSKHIKVTSICAHVSFGGRLDHVMANFNALYRAQQMTSLPLYLISEESLALLIPKGTTKVHVGSSRLGAWCGLVPLSGPCDSVTTTGLQYNMDHQRSEFGGLVSTSNRIEKPVVKVETDNSLLFTIRMSEDHNQTLCVTADRSQNGTA